MPGELFREIVQIGKETTAGVAVAATRKLYLKDVSFTRQRDKRVHQFATGTRDNVRASTLGPVQAGGAVKCDISADELLELLLITVQGGVTPTTPSGATNARLWTFKPSNTLDSATFERNDGANLQRLLGARGNQLTIAGAVDGANEATLDLFATDRQDNWAGPLASLTDRVPTFMEGWQTRLWIDPLGSAPGGILIPNALINWNVKFGGNLGRKYTANNSLAATSVTLGMLDITATLMLEAAAAQALTELANFDANTGRMVRLEFLGPVAGIEAGANEVQSVSESGVPTGGTFTLVVFGSTTGNIAFNSTAAQLLAILQALPFGVDAQGNSNFATAGGPLPGSPITVTFQNQLAQQDLPQMTVGTNALTGGTTPAPAVSTTTPGRSGARFVTIDLPGVWDTPDANQNNQGTRTYSFPFQYVYDATSLAAGIQIRCQNARTSAY
jgi:hypothetical protein